MTSTLLVVFLAIVLAVALHRTSQGVYNYLLHPLVRFPGPRLAAISRWYKTCQEVFLDRSWTGVLDDLHHQYGDIVRVGPNELHFANPSAYMDIYNNSNRWNKEQTLYHCFGEDRSSFGFLTYAEAKQRKDIIAPLFSKRAIVDLQSVVKKNIDRLCDGLAANHAAKQSSDMLFGLRCFTLDTITQFCFAKDVNATAAADF